MICLCQAEDGIRDTSVTGGQTCALPIYPKMSRNVTLSTITHEMGHIVLFDMIQKGDFPVEVVDEYNAWLDSINEDDPLVRELFKDRVQMAVGSLQTAALNVSVSDFRKKSPESDQYINYLTDFHEWFADRVRNRLLDPTPPKGNFERGLEGIVKQLRKIFGMGVTVERTVEDFTDSLMKRSN